MKNWRMVPAAASLALLAACGGEGSNEGLVARAGDHRLTVDQVTELLVDQENLPNDVEVVRALAEIWVDYTLLAAEVARDSTLGQLDLEPLIRQQLDQEMIFQLRDSVIQVDTVISEEELRAGYEQEAPDATLRASHILMGFPAQATQAQRDSVRQILDGVRRRAVSGESFASLAGQYSQDPGTASQGGDLGTFGRGEMVKPFEDAAFALQVGEISDVVETPYGLHVIRLQEKEAPGFDQVKDQFRMRMLNLRFIQAESIYIAGVEERGDLQIADGAHDVVRELARDASIRLSGRAARRALVTFNGGSVTVGDYLHILQEQQPQFRQQVQAAPDDQIENFLNGLGQRKLLVAEAEAAGLGPSRARVDSLVAEARQGILNVAGEMGLRRLERAPGEALTPAVARAVRASLQDVLNGAKDVVPLGGIAFQLRSRHPAVFLDTGIGQVVVNVAQARTSRSPSTGETPPAPDTTGN